MSAFEDLIPESLSLAQQHIPITTLHTHLWVYIGRYLFLPIFHNFVLNILASQWLKRKKFQLLPSSHNSWRFRLSCGDRCERQNTKIPKKSL
jgi:hypothetical protein